MLCDGCNVREPWEHKCFGPQCSCEECKEERELFDTVKELSKDNG